MNKYYITFGQGHTHTINNKTIDKDTVVCISEENYSKAREKTFKLFGDKFFIVYDNLDDVGIEFYPKGIIELGTNI